MVTEIVCHGKEGTVAGSSSRLGGSGNRDRTGSRVGYISFKDVPASDPFPEGPTVSSTAPAPGDQATQHMAGRHFPQAVASWRKGVGRQMSRTQELATPPLKCYESLCLCTLMTQAPSLH